MTLLAVGVFFVGMTACESDAAATEGLYDAECTTCDDLDVDNACTTCDDLDSDSECTTCDDLDTGGN